MKKKRSHGKPRSRESRLRQQSSAESSLRSDGSAGEDAKAMDDKDINALPGTVPPKIRTTRSKDGAPAVPVMTPTRRAKLLRTMTSAVSPTAQALMAQGTMKASPTAVNPLGGGAVVRPQVGDAVDWMLDPTDLVKQVWEAAFLTALLWIMLRIPFFVAFEYPFDQDMDLASTWIDDIVTVGFLLDVLATFRTVLEDDGDLVVDPKRIAVAYLRGYFFFHVIVSLPWYAVVDGYPSLRLLRILRCFPTSRLNSAEKTVMEWLSVGDKWYHAMVLFKLLTVIWIVAHASACLWHWIAIVEDNPRDSWTYMYEIGERNDVASRYSAALYWAFATLSTVGYGDVSAHTHLERGFSLIMIIAGAVVFAAIVGKVTAITAEMGADQAALRKKQQQLNNYLRLRDFPKEVRESARRYYAYVARVHPVANEDELLNDLSPSLRRSVLRHLNKSIVESVPILRYGGAGFTATFVTKLKEVICLPGEYVYCHGEAVREMYFISAGLVQLVTKDGVVASILEPGSFFGEVELIDRLRVVEAARCDTTCEFFMLSRQDLGDVLVDFPEFEDILRKVSALRKAMATTALEQAERVKKAKEDGPDKKDNLMQRAKSAISMLLNTVEEEQPQENRIGTTVPPPAGVVWNSAARGNRFSEYYDSILASAAKLHAPTYSPKPLDLSDAVVPQLLNTPEMLELLSRAAHTVYTTARIARGWKYGEVKDSSRRQRPDIVPFELLDDEARLAHLENTERLLKLLTKTGFGVHAVPGKSVRFADNAVAQWDFGTVEPEVDEETGELQHISAEQIEEYEPRPYPVESIIVKGAPERAVDAICSELHDAWAHEKQAAGWVWSPFRSNRRFQHDCLIPWTFMTEKQKENERVSVLTMIRTIMAMGYKIEPQTISIGAAMRVTALRAFARRSSQPQQSALAVAAKFASSKALLKRAASGPGRAGGASRSAAGPLLAKMSSAGKSRPGGLLAALRAGGSSGGTTNGGTGSHAGGGASEAAVAELSTRLSSVEKSVARLVELVTARLPAPGQHAAVPPSLAAAAGGDAPPTPTDRAH